MYMIMINKGGQDPALIPYTGVIHNTKQDTLSEYLEACREHNRTDVYVVIV